MVAIADMQQATRSNNVKKAMIFTFNELHEEISSRALKTETYNLPTEMTLSANALKSQNREKWLEKRNKRFEQLGALTQVDMVTKYLFDGGIHDEIEELIRNGSEWKTRGAFYNALNRYIAYGMSVMALTPVGLKNTGNNFTYVNKQGEPIKRGRRKSRSQSRGIVEQDKKNIVQVIKDMGGKKKKFSIERAYRNYYKRFCRTEIKRSNPVSGREEIIYVGFPRHELISKQQFRYHFNKLLDPQTKKLIIHGKNSFEKDYADRQGKSHDGVIGATYRYEVDATVLDIYVRYPYDSSDRYSMGRPVLYLVVDVYSTMITGFYLGFDGPHWQGMANAYVNACLNKVEFAARYGLQIERDDWPAHHVPYSVLCDNGGETPDALIESVLLSQIGIQTFSFTAAYRGDLKGVVEGSFNIINNLRIQYLAGGIFNEQDRTDQHASNQSFWNYDDLVRKLITIVIEHNKSADRLSKQNINMMRDGIGITPQAIFEYSLREEMNGGRPTKPEDEDIIRWAFLPEEMATVRSDCVYFKGLEYHSPEIKKRGLYAKATNGRFKIPVKRAHHSVNKIWHRTDDGEYIQIELKNTNNESAYINQCWEAVLHRIEQNKNIQYENEQNQLKQMNRADERIAATIEGIKAELKHTQPSTRKSMQPGIKQRKDTQVAIQQAQDRMDLARALKPNDETLPSSSPRIYHNTTDDDIFG